MGDLFQVYFPDHPPISKSTISRVVNKFLEHGTVKDLPRSGRPLVSTSPEKTEEVLLTYIENTRTSTRKAAQATDISDFSIRKILHKNN